MGNNIYKNADSNIRKTWLFMLMFLVVVIGLGYFFAYLYGNTNILYIAIIFALFMNVFSYWYSDKIVLAMHGAKEATRGEYFDLYTVTENMAITAGLPKPRIFVIEDSAPNAFATGRDKEHAVICVTTGLLSLLDRKELEGVVAHELSHIGNKDILLSTIIVVMVGFVAILSNFFIRSRMFGGGRRDDREGQLGAILMIVGVVLAILSPIIATLIQLAISRKREFLADASGVLLTRYPEGLANALRKISAYSAPMHTANNADAHLFISNPFGSGEKSVSMMQKLFMTHPPTKERIEALVGSGN